MLIRILLLSLISGAALAQQPTPEQQNAALQSALRKSMQQTQQCSASAIDDAVKYEAEIAALRAQLEAAKKPKDEAKK